MFELLVVVRCCRFEVSEESRGVVIINSTMVLTTCVKLRGAFVYILLLSYLVMLSCII